MRKVFAKILLNVGRMFDDFGQMLASWGASEICRATSWSSGVQVQIFDEFWRLQGLILEPWRHPWGDIFTTLTSLCDIFVACMFLNTFRTQFFVDFGRPWALKSECFASEGLQKQENQPFQKKYQK